MPARPFVTLHAPMPASMAEEVLNKAEDYLKPFRVKSWLQPEGNPPDRMVLMVDVPLIWHTRAGTEKEIDAIYQAINDGDEERFEHLMNHGLPPHLR